MKIALNNAPGRAKISQNPSGDW